MGKWIRNGIFKKIFPNGKGKKRWKNGSEYEGNFEEGKENGKGKKKLKEKEFGFGLMGINTWEVLKMENMMDMVY